MKLLTRYNRVNLAATIVVLLMSSVCYYFILRFVLIHQLDQDIKVEEQEVIDYISANNKLPEPTNYKGQQVKFDVLNDAAVVTRKLGSKANYDRHEHENNSIRELVFGVRVNGAMYKVSISKSQAESEDLLKLIVIITLVLTALLLLVLFVVNRFVFNKLWMPFNNTLKQLQQFNLSTKNSLQLEESNINEFKELNKAVTVMTNRVLQDYESLKSFTENASHEIQTPLAIINSKIELLFQSENLEEEQAHIVTHVQDAANRLSKLNQSLILLTKIENQQFRNNEKIDLTKIINRQLENYEELIAVKYIKVSAVIGNNIQVLMDETLAEILISNIITNAIKHNIEHGIININAEENKLVVSNTGLPLKANADLMFNRFQKDSGTSESLGLGLSIVKKISEQYGISVSYVYESSLHIIQLTF